MKKLIVWKKKTEKIAKKVGSEGRKKIPEKIVFENKLLKDFSSEFTKLNKKISTKIDFIGKNVDNVAKNLDMRLAKYSELELNYKELESAHRKLAGEYAKLKEELESFRRNYSEEIAKKENEISANISKELSEKFENEFLLRLEAETARLNAEFREKEIKLREELEAELKKRDGEHRQKVAEEFKKLESMLNAEMKEIMYLREELRKKEDLLKGMEREIGKRAEELDTIWEAKIEKAKTGTPSLDDLLYGGIPFGTNIILYGYHHMGMETLIGNFIAEGLSRGIPAIWVSTKRSVHSIRKEMHLITPNFKEYEDKGLIKYIDAYSRKLGVEIRDPHVVYVDRITKRDSLYNMVVNIGKEYRKTHEYYRVVFESLVDLYEDLGKLNEEVAKAGILPMFLKRVKVDRAICMFTLEKGITDENAYISSLEPLMDGKIEFKFENQKTYLIVKGITNTKWNDWVEYTYDVKKVNLSTVYWERREFI